MAHRTSMSALEAAVAGMNRLVGKEPLAEGSFQLQANISGYAVNQRNKSGGCLEVFGYDRAAVIRAQIYAWCNGFKAGREAS